MFEQLLAHLFGDFILQNDEVGLHKKDKNARGLFFCILHCVIYGLVFLLITNWLAALCIAIAHFIIDRWNIIGRFIQFKNGVSDTSNFGYHKDRPMFMSACLYIIQDNTAHLIINYFIIKYIII
jgi:hypothetical protein